MNDNVIWVTTCIHGCSVRLYEDDWAGHVLRRHPEMIGLEDLVRRAVESPKQMRDGDYRDSRAFEVPSVAYPYGIRVFVRYKSERFAEGGVDGWVTTAYPIDPKFTFKAGKVIYTKPGGRQ